MDILEGLNEEQIRAITYGNGPLLIVAGAGTGKTTVITRRIAYLISSRMARPEEILAVTFTEKAASEMEERVDLLIPYGYANYWIGTFHAFGEMILRENALRLGLPLDLKVLSKPEQYIFFKEHLFEFPLNHYLPKGDPTRYIEAIINLISRAKDEDICPEDYINYAKSLTDSDRKKEAQEILEVALTYQKYEELMAKHGYIDFGDLIVLVLKLFRSYPNILMEYQERFKYILVDEFQDTNYAQFQVLKFLAERYKNINVVGDDDQSIYKFRGAAISNIINFKNVYPDAEEIILNKNYRSTIQILDAAYNLIKYNNPDRIEKKLISIRGDGEMVKYLHFDTLQGEAEGVCKIIKEKLKFNNYTYKDFAILVRRNSDADPLIKSLNMHSIPWKFTGNKGLYDREEIMFLISFLRVITNPENNYSLWFLCSSDIYNMDPMDLTKCNIFASKKNLPLYYIFEHIDEFENISDKDIAKRIVDDIKRYNKEIYRASTGELLYKFINESSYLKYLMDNSKGEEIQNIAKFFDIIANIGNVLHENRVYSFVSHLDMLIKAGDNPPVAQADYDSDSVNILTIHKAKGLEFRVVFMVGLVSGIFPSIYRKDTIELPPELIKDITVGKDFHKKEERRLFYVGMTRAKDELYLTSASDYGGERKKKISEFVSEALNLTKDHIILKASPLEIINRYGKVERDRKELPIPEDEIITLSYYQIDDYLTCPLKYKFIHIWKMPIFKHFSIIYGKSLHDAIQEYNRSRMKGENMSEEELISIFEKIWVSEGFLSREHEEERFEAGKRALREFYRKEALSDEKPSYIEEEFTFYLDNNRITGRWDRIDINNEEVTIIDYKSSDIRSEDDAIKRTKGSLQLSIYALAYRERFGRLPDWVELRFIETGFRGKIKKSEKDIEKVKNEIKKVSSGIRLRKFLSRPNYINCRYCACLEICPERSR